LSFSKLSRNLAAQQSQIMTRKLHENGSMRAMRIPAQTGHFFKAIGIGGLNQSE
jgi:hypothetical protein